MSRKDLHDKIMNIRFVERNMNTIRREKLTASHAYKTGHRDARHKAAELVIAHQGESPWIKIAEDGSNLPVGKIVFAYGINDYKNKRTVRAVYIPKHYKEVEGDYEDCPDYSNEKDLFYWPEGWYEWNEAEDVHWMLDLKITHFMLIPAPPEEE